MCTKNKKIEVFNIAEQTFWGYIDKTQVNDQYDKWRAEGYGVLIDRDGSICIDNETPDDDGLSYEEQIEELKDF